MEVKVIDGLIGDHVWWTAGSDMGFEGNWVWMRSLTLVTEWVWAAGAPNDGLNANCMQLNPNFDYGGYDAPCDDYSQPICQK